jgi:predicted transcriptional regulator
MSHAIISIHPKHVAHIRAGLKTVEIRKRKVALSPGSYLWIYTTLPVGAIQLVVEIAGIDVLSPGHAWKRFEDAIRISRSEYEEYVDGRDRISVIRLGKVMRLSNSLSLATLRRGKDGFHPPQFIKCLKEGERLLRLLAKKKPSVFVNGGRQ